MTKPPYDGYWMVIRWLLNQRRWWIHWLVNIFPIQWLTTWCTRVNYRGIWKIWKFPEIGVYTPSHHPFVDGFSLTKTNQLLGSPMTMETSIWWFLDVAVVIPTGSTSECSENGHADVVVIWMVQFSEWLSKSPINWGSINCLTIIPQLEFAAVPYNNQSSKICSIAVVEIDFIVEK